MRYPAPAARGVVWCYSTPVACSRNHSIYHCALVCVCCTTGDDVRASFSKAMVMWERETCVRFVPRTTEEDYVELGEGG